MAECFAALNQAFTEYRQELEEYARKSKPTDGLLGFGRSLKDDPCHDRFDERVKEAVDGIVAASPTPEAAKQTVGMLLRSDTQSWPLAAQWMLRAIERHILPLIPFLSPDASAAFQKEYAARYKPWDRLPVQQEVFKALKRQAGTANLHKKAKKT